MLCSRQHQHIESVQMKGEGSLEIEIDDIRGQPVGIERNTIG